MTELTLTQIIQIARRWWWVLLLGPILGGVIGSTLASRAEPLYQSETKLLLDRPTLDTAQESSSSAYNNILAAEQLTETYGQLVETRFVLNEALTRMGAEADGLTVDDLESAITVTVIEDTQIIEVEAVTNDPELSALILNLVTAIFIEQSSNLQPDVSNANTDALQESIDDIVEDMATTQTEISALEARDDATGVSVQAQLREQRTLLGEYQSRHAELVEIQQRMAISAAETGVTVRVVDPAVPPEKPITSNPAFTVFLGIIGGLAIAGAIVFILGYLDNTVKEPATIQRVTGRNTLGLIPEFSHPEHFEALTNMGAESAEAFRTLRTNLQFATLGSVVRSLVVTGARPGDGASTTAAYLAMVFAQGGQRVILVDSDLRDPSLHQSVGLPNRTGLTSLLLGDSLDHIEGYLRKTDVEQLLVLTSGPLPPNPADLLNSRRMADIIRSLEDRADLVIFDCPSLQYSDALILTGMVSGSLFIVSASKTRSNELAEGVNALEQSGKPIFGTVLNRVPSSKGRRNSPGHLIPQFHDHDPQETGTDPSGKRRRMPGFLSR